MGWLRRKNEYHRFVEAVKAAALIATAEAVQEQDSAKADFYRGIGLAVIASRRRPLPVAVTRGTNLAVGMEKGLELLRAGASAVEDSRSAPSVTLPPFRDEDRRPDTASAGPGWTIDDSPEQIWDVSISHMAEAVKGFATGPAQFPYEVLMKELIAAQLGFGRLVEIGYRSEFSMPLRDALDDWSEGVTIGDNDRAGRGYDAARNLVNALILAAGG